MIDFNGIILKAIYLEYSITGDDGKPIARPCFYQIMSETIWKYIVCTYNVNISIRRTQEWI